MEVVLPSSISVGTGAEIRVLGPIEVSGPAGRARFTGNRQPALVGLLALSAPELLPRARLIDGLWGDDPPRTAIKTLHSHIARVRAALDACGLPDALVTREPGYLLAVPPEAVDVHRFEHAAREARDLLVSGADVQAVHRLRDALALWRGDAFADAEPFGWGSADIARLNDVRLGALGDLWEGELRLGRHLAAAGELDRLLVTHPIHERFVQLAMLALYRSDRHSDALAAYRRFRERLADELGTEPGPELARLHVQILRRDPALDRGGPPSPRRVRRPDARPLPAELPAPVNHFTGRAGELAALDAYSTPAGPRVLVISGSAGMGKTALAVTWGHRATNRFGDGQIFIDMRGADAAAALSPSEALAHVLASLDQPDAAIPADLAGRAALYRSVTRDRHVLVTADNVARIDQVLPLVPASTTSLLVVTSRSRLMALTTYHEVGAVELDALRDDEAIDLLGAVLGHDRIAREPDGAARLAELCDRMPLALQIAAAKLGSRPHQEIGDLATTLSTDRRLDGLAMEGDTRSVRTVFATAYDMLAPEAALVFRSIGLHAGRTCTAHLAAAAADIPLDAARKAMDELSAAHLVVEVSRDRYQFHDLIRLYAAERTGSDRAADVMDRIIDWYLAAAAGANRIVDRGRDRVQIAPHDPPYELPFGTDPVGALEFLDRERDTMLPLMAYAIDHGRPEVAWQITYLLTGFFNSRGRWAQRVAMCRLGITGAVAAGDVVAEGLMHSGLGVAHLMTQRVDDALDEFGAALDRMRRGGDRQGEAHVHNNIAVAYAGLRRYDDAVAAYRRALDLHSAIGSPLGVALSLNNLGDAYVKMGRGDLGLDYLTRALAAVRAIDNIRLEAAALNGLGQAHRQQGNWDDAVAYFTLALALRRETGDRSNEADTLNNLGRTEFARNRDQVAADHFHRAQALSREIDDPNQEAIALARLGRIHLRAARYREAGDYLRLAAAARELAPDPHEEAVIRQGLADAEARGDASSAHPVA
jgi:DNA-binding SARP family transcriptional activator/Tfp pilus assembly protein PilF